MKPPNLCTIDLSLFAGGRGLAVLPNYIHVGHRHFQKEQPAPVAKSSEKTGLYRLPVDYLKLVVPAGSLVADEIEEVLVGYVKG